MAIHTHTEAAWTKLNCDGCDEERAAAHEEYVAAEAERETFVQSLAANHNHRRYETTPDCPACKAIVERYGHLRGDEPNSNAAHWSSVVAD